MTAEAPAHIIRDLSSKVANDVLETIARTVALVDHPSDQTALSVAALRAAIAVAVNCTTRGLAAAGTPVPRETVLQVVIAKIENMK